MTATVRVTAFVEHLGVRAKKTRYEVWTAVQARIAGEPKELVFDVFNPIHAMAFGRASELGRAVRVTYHDTQHWRQVDDVQLLEPDHAVRPEA